MKEFSGKYSLSKTLRFELQPIGKTLAHIEEKGILTKDNQRAVSYQKMKKTIDAFHKHFIEIALQNLRLVNLEKYQTLYLAPTEQKKESKFADELKKVRENLRKEIVAGFKTGPAKEVFDKLDKKELFTEILENWIKEQKEGEDIYFDEGFKTFTTYFGGFHENRKNMYSDKEQSTAIAYRLIHENLPKFIDNILIFERIKDIPELNEKCKELYKEIGAYLNIHSINEAFELEYFNEVLTQKGIDVYNLIIGGRVEGEGKKKIKGLNEYINTDYNQKQTDKNKRIPKFKMLYKQILSDRESTSFIADKFENSEEVLNAINEYYHHYLISFQPKGKDDTENVLLEIQQIFKNIADYKLDKIYLRNDKALTDISNTLFGDWSVILNALEFAFLKKLEVEHKKIQSKQMKALEAYLKQDYFSIAEIEEALHAYRDQLDVLKSIEPDQHPIADYFHTHFKATKKENTEKEFDFVSNIEAKYRCVKGVLENYPKDRKLHQDKKTIDDIKLFLDSIMELLHFVKPLMLRPEDILEKDNDFYGQIEQWYEQLEVLVPLYNKVRNYATQKAYSIEKYKLNFDNSTLLNGWDVNKEEDNSAVLFRKGDLYYLGIMDKNHNKIFRKIPRAKSDDTYQKMNYKLLPGASKMLPKVFFSAKNIEFYGPNDEIQKIRNHSTHTKSGSPQKGFEKLDFNVKDCRKMIDFFKDSIHKHPEWRNFGFDFSSTDFYESIDGFYREVETQGYTISYTDVDKSYIDQLVDEGKLYLFQIYNKDFSPYSKGKPNMHTLYWKALFDPENLRDVVYKLNGQAEIFYRKKSIDADKIVVHKAKDAIDNKNPKATKKQSVFEYDLIKDKRFTIDKFQFHVPITLNFKAHGNEYLNNDVLAYLKNNPNVNIIGIDRGERHLIYITLIDQKGNILRQETLNSIIDEITKKETPYHLLLSKKEEERDKARKSWNLIENIKELKEGYLSQVVHKIARLMVEYNAIVVMEDLNFGFKRGRFKVEKQVYQKLEKMLIDKLNYLVFKDKEPNEPGGLYNALQLTNKFTSFKDMGKQSGFLFYVPAWNTSKIDPTTGFVNLFNTRYESVENARKFFGNFKSIRFNAEKHYFEFEFDYNDFTTRAEGTKTNWTVCTYGERIMTFRNSEKNNQWDNKVINLTEQFEELLGSKSVVYGDGKCIKEQIASIDDKGFFEKLLSLFKLTLQMRNSKTNSEVDFLISPVMNKRGTFYDSREADDSLPKDADANGAYHIAKKGLMWLETLHDFDGKQKSTEDYDWKKLDFDKTNKGWLNFIQNNT